MFRRLPHPTSAFRWTILVAGFVLLGLVGWAPSAARQLPDNARFAKNAGFAYPYVKIGANVLRLAVGGKIYNQSNLIIVPVSAPPVANVLYKTDMNGEISQIWILTDEETKTYGRKPFKPAAQPRQ